MKGTVSLSYYLHTVSKELYADNLCHLYTVPNYYMKID